MFNFLFLLLYAMTCEAIRIREKKGTVNEFQLCLSAVLALTCEAVSIKEKNKNFRRISICLPAMQ